MEYAHRGVDCAETVAELVAPLLGWDDAQAAKEIKVFKDRTEAALAAEKQLTDEKANEIATAVGDSRPDIDTSQDRCP